MPLRSSPNVSRNSPSSAEQAGARQQHGESKWMARRGARPQRSPGALLNLQSRQGRRGGLETGVDGPEGQTARAGLFVVPAGSSTAATLSLISTLLECTAQPIHPVLPHPLTSKLVRVQQVQDAKQLPHVVLHRRACMRGEGEKQSLACCSVLACQG